MVQVKSVAEAAQLKLVDVVAQMLEAGHSANSQDSDGQTALHWAALFGLDTLAAKLLGAGARQDVVNSRGESPAHMAAKSSCIPVLNLLITQDRHAVLASRDCDGFTPFLACAQENSTSVLEWFHLQGASLEERDDEGRTPLMWASYKGHLRTVQWLLARSASAVSEDNDGMTALHWAAVRGQGPIVKMLLDAGAAGLVFAPDSSGDTPLALARRRGYWTVVFGLLHATASLRLCGRARLFKSPLAPVFAVAALYNIAVFALCVAPQVSETRQTLAYAWVALMSVSLLMWAAAVLSNPGWAQPRTTAPRSEGACCTQDLARLKYWKKSVDDQIEAAFESDAALAALESEAASMEPLGEGPSKPRSFTVAWRRDAPSSPLLLPTLEALQRRIAEQQQLLAVVRRALDERGGDVSRRSQHSAQSGSVAGGSTLRSGAELQPLIAAGASAAAASAPASPAPASEQSSLARLSDSRLSDLAHRTAERLSLERRLHLQRRGGSGPEYVRRISMGDLRNMCVVCRAPRGLRTFHCKECGRCVQRLDHHCPWIDNCVGLGNQRLFYCFIIDLAAALSLMLLLCIDAMFKAKPVGKFVASDIAVVLAMCVDTLLFIFVCTLVLRQTAYMLVNMTTYEVLLAPQHVHSRFPSREQRFWFCAGFSFHHALRSCYGYWAPDTGYDAEDFGIQVEVGQQGSDAEATGAGGVGGSFLGKLVRKGLSCCCCCCCGDLESQGAYMHYAPGSLQANTLSPPPSPSASAGGAGRVGGSPPPSPPPSLPAAAQPSRGSFSGGSRVLSVPTSMLSPCRQGGVRSQELTEPPNLGPIPALPPFRATGAVSAVSAASGASAAASASGAGGTAGFGGVVRAGAGGAGGVGGGGGDGGGGFGGVVRSGAGDAGARPLGLLGAVDEAVVVE